MRRAYTQLSEDRRQMLDMIAVQTGFRPSAQATSHMGGLGAISARLFAEYQCWSYSGEQEVFDFSLTIGREKQLLQLLKALMLEAALEQTKMCLSSLAASMQIRCDGFSQLDV